MSQYPSAIPSLKYHLGIFHDWRRQKSFLFYCSRRHDFYLLKIKKKGTKIPSRKMSFKVATNWLKLVTTVSIKIILSTWNSIRPRHCHNNHSRGIKTCWNFWISLFFFSFWGNCRRRGKKEEKFHFRFFPFVCDCADDEESFRVIRTSFFFFIFRQWMEMFAVFLLCS